MASAQVLKNEKIYEAYKLAYIWTGASLAPSRYGIGHTLMSPDSVYNERACEETDTKMSKCQNVRTNRYINQKL